jgi:hypothetical protein
MNSPMGHRLRQESRCSNDLGRKYGEIGLIKKVTATVLKSYLALGTRNSCEKLQDYVAQNP